MNPPPLPTARKQSRSGIWIILVAVGVLVLGAGGVLTALVLPAFRIVRTTAMKERDEAALREVVQAATVWSSVHDGALPPVHLSPQGAPSEHELATIHAVAAALARGAGLNDMSMWLSHREAAESRDTIDGPIIERLDRGVTPAFGELNTVAWDFVTGLDDTMPAATPVAWTRGLRTDGSWGDDSRYDGAGGFIGFLGGNVQFYRNLQTMPLAALDGSATSNILETLPTSVRVVGRGPGTLHGELGRAATD